MEIKVKSDHSGGDWIHVEVDGELVYEGHAELSEVICAIRDPLKKCGVEIQEQFGRFSQDPGSRRHWNWTAKE